MSRRAVGIENAESGAAATASGPGNRRSSSGHPSTSARIDIDADRVDEFRRHRSGAGHGDLLPDDRPHQRLERVDAARRATAGNRPDERTENRVGDEVTVDGDGVCVEVEHPADALHGGREVGPVIDPDARDDVIGTRRDRERYGTVAVREGQRAAIRGTRVDELERLDAGDCAATEELEDLGSSERSAGREPQLSRSPAGRTRFDRHADGETSPTAEARVGVASNTSRIVSLNCRTLPKPAANATSVSGRSVVSIEHT